MTDLTSRNSHFEFGKNWSDFLASIDDVRVLSAVEGVRKLLPDLTGKSFLDVGSGSGLSSLAALMLGASRVLAVDIDENSVAATQKLLSERKSEGEWEVRQASVFELAPELIARFDFVHSWGVLHHTGNMRRAFECAAKCVAPGGSFAFAIYNKTSMCGFWRNEKRFYSSCPSFIQACVRYAYAGAFLAACPLAGHNPIRYVREYGRSRGMRWLNDVHDWLGGYPYKSASPSEIDEIMTRLGFRMERQFLKNSGVSIFGSGCSEYVYRRP